ncbi:Zinc phosphodiesterase ELAC protein 2 [Galdieria sulphuraria]|nr:Zinc phosphodiesterase ELAC protein 2 [Galdieria sulphuraria]
MVQCHLQVVGSGKADTGLSIILFFDDHRYLFNCGEGTQRLCAEKGLNLFRVDTVFFTGLDARCAGGLFGTLLTLADAGKTHLELFGPTGLVRFFAASSCFYRRPSLELSLKEVGTGAIDGKVYRDENIEVTAVPLVCECSPTNLEIPSSKQKKPRTTFQTSILCYVITMKDIPGKFDPLAAKALNVPKGPLFGRLSKGETITLSDGKKIMPSQVVSEPFPGPCIAIIFCPDIHYISSVTSSSRLNRFALRAIENPKRKERHLCVVHMAVCAVLENRTYIEWAKSLGNNVHHILLLEDSLDAPLIFEAQAELLKLLSGCVDREMFQIPKDTSNLEKSERKVFCDLKKNILEKWNDIDAIFGESLLKYHLAPISRLGMDPTSITGRAYQDGIDSNTESKNETLFSSETWKSKDIASSRKSPSCFEDVGEMVFLGTGAAIPSKLRNIVEKELLDKYYECLV